MRFTLSILLFLSLSLRAQDKIFFKSGKTAQGKFISFNSQIAYFIYQDSVEASEIDKNTILLIERENGERYLIGNEKNKLRPNPLDSTLNSVAKNALGMQPFGVFSGRLTFVYERFLLQGKMGLSIPFSLTFDPFGVIYNSAADTSMDAPEHIPGISYITGIDLNYYFFEEDGTRFFMGPRLRYGTDKMLRGIEGYSIQYQLGLQVQSETRFSQHLSVGYGFAKILNVPSGSAFNPEQLYGWLSINYRLSFLW